MMGSADPAGECTLRAAVEESNASVGVLDTIQFQLAGPTPHRIALYFDLPWIIDPAIIDGTSQQGYSGSPVVELAGAASGSAFIGIRLARSGATVRGLSVVGFLDGIDVGDNLDANPPASGNNTIVGNYIGVNAAGAAEGNPFFGIRVDDSAHNLIGGPGAGMGNVVSGNGSEIEQSGSLWLGT